MDFLVISGLFLMMISTSSGKVDPKVDEAVDKTYTELINITPSRAFSMIGEYILLDVTFMKHTVGLNAVLTEFGDKLTKLGDNFPLFQHYLLYINGKFTNKVLAKVYEVAPKGTFDRRPTPQKNCAASIINLYQSRHKNIENTLKPKFKHYVGYAGIFDDMGSFLTTGNVSDVLKKTAKFFPASMPGSKYYQELAHAMKDYDAALHKSAFFKSFEKKMAISGLEMNHITNLIAFADYLFGLGYK